MGVEVQAWGHLGTASFAELGAGGKSPPVLDRGRDLLCTPSVTCEGMAKTLLPLTSLFSFPRSPPGQHWGLAGPQPMWPLDSPSPPLWPWRTLLLLRSPQHETGAPKGEPGIGHGPTGLPCHPPPPPLKQGSGTVGVMKGQQNLCLSCRDGFRHQFYSQYQDPTVLWWVEVYRISAGTKEAPGI